MNNDPIQRKIADRYTGERCYLDGAPARITGRLNSVGTVAPDDPAVSSVEFSWHAINRIMQAGGYFRTGY